MSDIMSEALKKAAEEGVKKKPDFLPENFQDIHSDNINDFQDADKIDWKNDEGFNNENQVNAIQSFADADKIDRQDLNEKGGGAYKELPRKEGHEIHHMPADSAAEEILRGDGPAIVMEKEDHRQTASCGNSKEAQEYRAEQKKLIDEGKYKEAQQMDIDDIREKFGDTYNDQIAEMEEYTDNYLKNRGEN